MSDTGTTNDKDNDHSSDGDDYGSSNADPKHDMTYDTCYMRYDTLPSFTGDTYSRSADSSTHRLDFNYV